MKRLTILAACAIVSACSEAPAGEAVVAVNLDGSERTASAAPSPTATAPVVDSACRAVVFEQAALTHCIADPARHRIDMANLGADKQPFGSLAAFGASIDPARSSHARAGSR
jgi:uncharacterized protein YigE (DUF2233 family)